jgi:crotonobetainyl-CoA:carnitine CoA-transferase CaiB-like acyl-CoA transferase
MTPSDKKVLDGIRVVDLSRVLAGPYCGQLLADFGADVIKVEAPGGDENRGWPPLGPNGEAANFASVNRGKRSLVLDLKSSDGQRALTHLARSTDILVENYRPGVMRSLGLDYQTLAAVNQGLIYASISGYGQTGPDRGKGGFDLIAQGVTGIMSITGEPGGAPVKAGIPVTDLGAALFALAGILAALEYRHRTGRGQYVDTSLVEAGVALSVWEATEYFSGLGTPEPMGSAHRMNAPYQAVRCADGYITIGANTDRLFHRLCEALGHNEWVDDSAFADNASRVRNRTRLAALIETVTVGHPRRRWLELLEAREIPCGPINDYSQVFADSQIRAREMVGETDHPVLGHLRTLGSPIKLSGTPPDASRRAPLLGEHTREVLEEFGLSGEEIDKLVYHG